jgi:GTP cyclohydrolase I
MTSRGVKNDTSVAITSSMLGCFEKDEKIRNEFLNLIKK